MVHVGLDLSRTLLDVHVMDESGAPLAVTTALPEAGGLAALVGRIEKFGGPVHAGIESMNGARSFTTSWSWRAGRSRSPTRTRSKGWPRWPARPTRSTRGCWPSCRAGII